MEEQPVFLIRHIEFSLFFPYTDQDGPDGPVGPFSLDRMELQLGGPRMGPFHIETVIHPGIPLVAHKDNRPVPGEVPRIQALISRILIQMDDPLIGLKTGNFGIAIQIPDGTVIDMKGDPSVGSDPGIQILVIHLALQLGTAAFQIRLQRTAGSND